MLPIVLLTSRIIRRSSVRLFLISHPVVEYLLKWYMWLFFLTFLAFLSVCQSYNTLLNCICNNLVENFETGVTFFYIANSKLTMNIVDLRINKYCALCKGKDKLILCCICLLVRYMWPYLLMIFVCDCNSLTIVS